MIEDGKNSGNDADGRVLRLTTSRAFDDDGNANESERLPCWRDVLGMGTAMEDGGIEVENTSVRCRLGTPALPGGGRRMSFIGESWRGDAKDHNLRFLETGKE